MDKEKRKEARRWKKGAEGDRAIVYLYEEGIEESDNRDLEIYLDASHRSKKISNEKVEKNIMLISGYVSAYFHDLISLCCAS